MTYKEQIVEILEAFPNGLSCQSINYKILNKTNKKAYVRRKPTPTFSLISSNVSSVLNRMLKKEEVFISTKYQGKKGGKVYVHNKYK